MRFVIFFVFLSTEKKKKDKGDKPRSARKVSRSMSCAERTFHSMSYQNKRICCINIVVLVAIVELSRCSFALVCQIMKDMERWAKNLNAAKDATKAALAAAQAAQPLRRPTHRSRLFVH